MPTPKEIHGWAPKPKEARLIELLRAELAPTKTEIYRKDPVLWCREKLPNVVMWSGLQRTLESVRDNPETLFQSCNAAGKSFAASVVLLHFIDTHSPCKILTTGSSWRALKEHVWPYAHSLIKKNNLFPNTGPFDILDMSIKLAGDRTAYAASTNDPEGIAGAHSEHLLQIIEEASGIEKPIAEAIQGNARGEGSRTLWMYNPLRPSGPAYDKSRSGRINLIKISALDHPNVKEGKELIPGAVVRADVERDAIDWCTPCAPNTPGATHLPWLGIAGWYMPSPVFMARDLGEFPEIDLDALISAPKINECANRKIKDSIPTALGIDVARSENGDETTFALANDSGIISVEAIRTNDLVIVMGKALEILAANPTVQRTAVDDTGLGCLVKGTNVLTSYGWMPVESLKAGDEILSKDSGGNVIIAKAFAVTKHKNIRTLKSGDYAFSACHSHVHRARREYAFRVSSWESLCKKAYVSLDTEFKWAGFDTDISFPAHIGTMPYGGEKTYKAALHFDGDLFAELLGWFISEGHTIRSEIGISQKKPIRRKEIKQLLDAMGIAHQERDGCYRWRHKHLASWLRAECYLPGQERAALRIKIPQWLRGQTPRRINLFLDAFCKGDGTFRKGSRDLYTSSKKLSDDLQVLFLKAGRYATIQVRAEAGSVGKLDGREFKRTVNSLVVSEWRGKQGASHKFGTISESVEDVFEVTLIGSPTSLYMVRFADMRPHWTHNGGVTDGLRANRKAVLPVNFGNKPTEKEDTFLNLKAQVYWQFKDKIERDSEYSIPNDPLLIEQIKGFKPDFGMSGSKVKIKIEDKAVYKKRMGYSPDRAEACIYAAYCAKYAGLSVHNGVYDEPDVDPYADYEEQGHVRHQSMFR